MLMKVQQQKKGYMTSLAQYFREQHNSAPVKP